MSGESVDAVKNNAFPAARCRVAVIGAGYMAREHVRAFREVPGVSVSGIYSRTKSAADELATQFGIPSVCGSVEELYDRTRAELVVICVPELATRNVCEDALRYPWSLLVEKPAGYDLKDAERILERSHENKRNVYVALNRRHYSSTNSIVRDMSTCEGSRFIKIQDQEDRDAALRAGQPALVVQNWMYANSIHLIDLFHVLGRGNVVEVTPIVPWNGGRSKLVVALIRFDSGDLGLYEAIWEGPGPWAVSVNTSLRRWEMRPLERASYQEAGERTINNWDVDEIDTKFKPGLVVQARQAVVAATGGVSTLPTLDDSLRSMRLAHAIYR